MNSKHKLGTSIFLCSLALIGVTVSAAVMTANKKSALNANGVFGDTSDYTVVLDESNAYTSGTTKEVTTSSGSWQISFAYSNASALSGGHVTLANGGTLVNTRDIISIDYLKVHCGGSGTLRFRTSYDGATWGGYADIKDNEVYNLGSLPYYVELSATGGSVNIYQATYQYTCNPNPNAQGTEVVTEEETTWDLVTSASDFAAGDEVVIAGSTDGETFYALKNEILNSYYLNCESLTVENYQATVTSDYDVWTVGGSSGAWTFNCGSNYLHSYVDGTHYTVIVQEETTTTWSVNFSGTYAVTQSSESVYLRYQYYNSKTHEFCGTNGVTTSYRNSIYFFKKHVTPGESHTEYDTPVDMVGFTVEDTKASGVYDTNSIYSSANGLVVKAKYNDGTQTTLNSSQYTYVVKNSNGTTINASQAFGTAGTYTVTVSYSTFIDQTINIYVDTPLPVLQRIDVNSTTLTFNTAQKMSDYVSGVTADLTYDQSSANVTGLAYSQFASKGVALSLLTPAGVTYDISTVFGTAGKWTLKVASTSNSSMFGTLEITVNAIPVETISLSASSTTIEEGKTVQLVTSVNPSTATNQELTWASGDESVATVNNSGLVTAVSAGEVVITATAKDGSNVVGSITITVTEKITGQDEGTFTLSTGDLTIGSYVVITDNTSDGSGYAMSSTQSENNRRGTDITVNNGTLERDSTSAFSAFLVKQGTTEGTYAFYDEVAEGYLYAASSTKNYLRTESTLSENSSFTISGSEGKTITAQGSNSHNLLKWNSQSSLFSCYASGQTAPYIYEKAGTPVYPTAITVSGTQAIGVGETSQLTVAYTPSNATVKSVTYESSDDLVATVSSTGLVTGIKAGSTTITVTGYNGITDTIDITVSNIAVSSVSLNKNSTSLVVDGTETLTATISPSNATNKSVTWSTSDNSVATVDNGKITAVGAGSANITVTTVDGNKTATCAVTVTASGGGSTEEGLVTDNTQLSNGDTVIIRTDGGLGVTGFSGNKDATTSSTESEWVQFVVGNASSSGFTLYDNSASQYIASPSGNEFKYSSTGGTCSADEEGHLMCNGRYFVANGTYYRFYTSIGDYTPFFIYKVGSATPTDPTSIAINPSSAEIAQGGSKTLSVTYTPLGANQNKAVTWSSDTSGVTVDTSGKVSVASSVAIGTTATITAKLTNLPLITATCTVTVTGVTKADHTVLIYICGADLESKNSLATGDIQEMLKVSGQPDDVNIVIETGGASSWASTYGISSSKLQRYHIENKSLVLDDSLDTYASMGLTSTFQSFLEYGLTNYPAERTGVVLWNHGGGMRGVCYDEKKNDDNLLNSEVKAAVSGAMNNCGTTDKLEWIGYDACLMQVQDVAEFNSQYFNYMVASEESEAGYGWDYDNWVDDLYAKKTTPVILKAICDTFITDNGGVSSSSGDQTLSYLDLSYMSAYKTAWENMASQLANKITSSNRSSFNSAITSKVKHFADSDYDYFCTFDAKDFINKLASNSSFSSFRIDSSYTTAVLNAFANLVAYSTAQAGAGEAYGLCMYWCNSSSYSDMGTYYTTSQTNFTNWRSLNYNYGYYAS